MMGNDTRGPILASWRVSEALRRHPAVLETLLGLSPAFAPLRNPLVRGVQARLVTVAQAAQVAGLEPAALVRALNAAAGLAPAPEVPQGGGDAPAPAPLATVFERAVVAADLDVRPALARGEEPYHTIMAAAATVGPGQALRLRAGFEPAPLYDVLARRGFAHRARQLGPEAWEIIFLKTDGVPAPRPDAAGQAGEATSRQRAVAADAAGRAAAALPAHPDQPAVVTIDVSDLAPPEPLIRILEACEQLAPGQTLRVEHARRPVYLYPRLEELGYAHETRELGPGRVELRIRKPTTASNHDQ